VNLIKAHYPEGKRGRKPKEIETMLRMMMLQTWFNLSDEGVEDAIYDSYAMSRFIGVDFASGEQVPDATTLCKFRRRLAENGLSEKMFKAINQVIEDNGRMMQGGTIVDATIINAPSSTKNAEKKRDPEMHQVKKNNEWYFGMRAHIGVDAGTGFVHSLVATAANVSEVKVAPSLIRDSDEVVYGDAGYLGMEKYVEREAPLTYRINQQKGTMKLRYGDALYLSWEKYFDKQRSRVRAQVEYVFHVVKNIFGWRKVRYRGLAKNLNHAYLLFGSANIYMWGISGGKKRKD
jgi:IS5 family transposase